MSYFSGRFSFLLLFVFCYGTVPDLSVEAYDWRQGDIFVHDVMTKMTRDVCPVALRLLMSYAYVCTD